MMPLSEIHSGDIYSNPLMRGFGNLSGLEWHVIEKQGGLVKLQAMSVRGDFVSSPIWKRSSDRMFCESWRVFTGGVEGER